MFILSYVLTSDRWYGRRTIKTSVNYSDVIMSVMASQITGVSIVCLTICSGADKKNNIKVPLHWPLWGEFTDDRWIPLRKGQ